MSDFMKAKRSAGGFIIFPLSQIAFVSTAWRRGEPGQIVQREEVPALVEIEGQCLVRLESKDEEILLDHPIDEVWSWITDTEYQPEEKNDGNT